MAPIISVTILLFFSITSTLSPFILSSSVVQDLANLQPPPDFNSTIISNCLNNPSLRYCNSSPTGLNEIFKFTIVASHLCNESNNPNCVDSFPKIDLRSRPKIAPLYLSFTFFWKFCPLTILSIDLSNNSIKGSFPLDVLQCTQIQSLDLSHNGLSGDFPLHKFSPLTNLTLLNLSYNHFSETKMSDIDTEFFKRFNASSFLSSGLIPDRNKFTIKAVILLVCFPISVVLMVGCFGWLCFRRPDLLPRAFCRKNKFTLPMLKAATGGFSRKNLVGKAEGVDIYRGVLRDGTEVRIEIYWGDNSGESRERFVEECKVLAQLRHENIIRVLGWCNSRRMRAIVTEWMEGKNVEIWLSGSSPPPWKQRLKILMGVGKGVCYLQEEWPEVGYDLRTGSVLLSDELKPLISRFEVGDQSSNTRKIYKFGVFLLELVVNRMSGDEFESGELGFIDHIKMHYPGNLRKLIDERMKITKNSIDQVKKVIGIGLMCTDQSSNHQLHLAQISDMIITAYESWNVLDSPTHKRSHGDRGKGH